MRGTLQRYGDGRRLSGVSHFILLEGAIILLFRRGAAYLYTDDRTGQHHLRTMKRLHNKDAV